MGQLSNEHAAVEQGIHFLSGLICQRQWTGPWKEELLATWMLGLGAGWSRASRSTQGPTGSLCPGAPRQHPLGQVLPRGPAHQYLERRPPPIGPPHSGAAPITAPMGASN